MQNAEVQRGLQRAGFVSLPFVTLRVQALPLQNTVNLEWYATAGRTYYACHAEVVTSAELVRCVGEAMGRRPLVIPVPALVGRAILGVTETAARIARRTTILTADKANEFFQPAWTGDPAPLTRDSGWSAARDLRTGLAETYRWYRSAGWL